MNSSTDDTLVQQLQQVAASFSEEKVVPVTVVTSATEGSDPQKGSEKPQKKQTQATKPVVDEEQVKIVTALQSKFDSKGDRNVVDRNWKAAQIVFFDQAQYYLHVPLIQWLSSTFVFTAIYSVTFMTQLQMLAIAIEICTLLTCLLSISIASKNGSFSLFTLGFSSVVGAFSAQLLVTLLSMIL